ncbi:hypothetical protein M432DRAFT_610909 [Thermoascus aurantiacus ATCC 26904]
MKTFLLATGIITTILSGVVSATATPSYSANGVPIVAYGSGDNVFYGEPQSLIDEKATKIANGAECTKCVGHHGLCTIGEGNCYPPDGCYFCGGCGPDRARCQTPGEPCQCY